MSTVNKERARRLYRWLDIIRTYCGRNRITLRAIANGWQFKRAGICVNWWPKPNTVFVQRGPHGEHYMPLDDAGPRPRVLRCLRELMGDVCPVCGETVTCKELTDDGRMVGSCGDVFDRDLWNACHECDGQHSPLEPCPYKLRQVNLSVGYDAGFDDLDTPHFMPHDPEE